MRGQNNAAGTLSGGEGSLKRATDMTDCALPIRVSLRTARIYREKSRESHPRCNSRTRARTREQFLSSGRLVDLSSLFPLFSFFSFFFPQICLRTRYIARAMRTTGEFMIYGEINSSLRRDHMFSP